MKKYILYTLLTLVLGLMVYSGTKAYSQAVLHEEATAELVSHMGVKEKAKFQLSELVSKILGGFYENDQKVMLDELKIEQALHKSKAEEYALYFMLLLLILLGSYPFVSLRAFTFFGALAAVVTLFYGLVTPILMVTIHKEVDYLGEIVLSFESKGVMGSIGKLLENGDTVVAFVILLFSVIVPVTKTLALLFVSLFMTSKFAHSIVRFFKVIGKWSMVDVFVVAVFLVYLTSNKGDVSHAEIEVGLYFFLAYVILSMLVSLSADKMLHRLKQAS